MPSPLISICVPAYRAEKFLPAALESVRAQTFADWELIVTEDGSRDRTGDIVRAYAASVPQQVTYNRHDKNRGLPATRNTGIAAARGSWIAFLDSDDLWKPSHLADLAAIAQHNECELVYAGSEIFDDATGATLELRAPSAGDIATFPASLYLQHFVIQPSAVLIRRDVFDKHGLISEQYPICNDMEFWLRVAAGGGRFRYTGNLTLRYRKHGEAMSRKSAALIAETARICEAYGSRLAGLPASARRRRPADLYRYAGQVLLRDDPRGARTLFGNALRLHPTSTANLTYWAIASARSLFSSPAPST
jgi:glycosyltransferase involved in cell wall biosynthesis